MKLAGSNVRQLHTSDNGAFEMGDGYTLLKGLILAEIKGSTL